MDVLERKVLQPAAQQLGRVQVAWAPGAPAAACWRRLHRARTSWEAAAAALAAPAADSGAAGEAY